MSLENKYGKSAVDATRRNALPPYLDELFAGGIGGAGVETHDITLTTSGWSNLQQSVVLTCGATNSSDVICAANNTSMDSDYYMSAFGVSLSNVTVVEGEEEGQNTVTFTFTAVTVPTVNIDVVVIIVNADSSGGVPVATTSRVGVVKPDGTTISVDPNGTIHSIGGGGGGDSASVLYFYNRTVSVASNTEILRITNSGIDANTVVLECTFADPSAISGTVTWTSYEGYISFVGTCTSSTTANVTVSGITEGDLQYMPKSGGNFTGNVSILGDAVIPIKGTGKMVFGTYVYNGSNTTSISFTDANVSGCNYIITSCQDAGYPITSASINGANITVYFTTSLSLCRLNYIAFV